MKSTSPAAPREAQMLCWLASGEHEVAGFAYSVYPESSSVCLQNNSACSESNSVCLENSSVRLESNSVCPESSSVFL